MGIRYFTQYDTPLGSTPTVFELKHVKDRFKYVNIIFIEYAFILL